MKVVDVLICHVSALLGCNSEPKQHTRCFFMDTNFVSQLLNLYSNFSKVSRKDSFRFPEDVLEVGVQKNSFLEAEQFYFPLNLEETHWVGVCIDMSSWSLSVLDRNLSIKSDYMMNKEVRPIAQMFPYFAKQMGKHVASIDGKPLAINRPQWIPQNNVVSDSAVSSILFIQAHAVAGVDACRSITADVLDTEVERLAVTLYEGNVGPL